MSKMKIMIGLCKFFSYYHILPYKFNYFCYFVCIIQASAKKAKDFLPSSIRIDFRGLRLFSTLIDNLATMGVSSLTKAEISTAGMSTTSRPRGSVGEWRSWIWAVEASVVMLRKLTWMPWSMTRHLASSRSGMMWPMPGLERTATCGLLVSAAIVVLSL